MGEQKLVWEEKEYQEYIEPGVRELVKALHIFGIKTKMSCEGHILDPWHRGILTGVYPWPWIILMDEIEKVDVLQKNLDLWNREYPENNWILSRERIHGSFTPRHIDNMLREKPNMTILALTPESENRNWSPETLTMFQQHAKDFGQFLIDSTNAYSTL